MDTETKKLFINAVLEEYKSLRAEITKIVDRQYPILYWGISSIAIIIAALINSWHNLVNVPIIIPFLFLYILPCLLTAYVVTWSHIIIKMTKLGSYLFLLENKIAGLIMDKDFQKHTTIYEYDIYSIPIAWEHIIWRAGSHEFIIRTFNTIKWAIAGCYIFSNLLGTIFSVIFLWKGVNEPTKYIFLLLGIAYILWILVWRILFGFIFNEIEKAINEKKKYEYLSKS